MEALHGSGIADPAQNFLVASQGPLDEDGIPWWCWPRRLRLPKKKESAVQAHFDEYEQLKPLYSAFGARTQSLLRT